MRKNYFFLCALILSVVLVHAQDYSLLKPVAFPQAVLKNRQDKIKLPSSKAYNDTLYYEDFDSTGTGGLPAGWIAGNSSVPGYDWIWSNTSPGGQYSTNVGPLQSTTSSNGFLCMPLDFYNSPFPAGGPVAADAFVSSPAISISPRSAVLLRFQQYYRYCCSITNDWVVEVSANGVNWTPFDNKLGRSPSTSPTNPEFLEFDVSAVLANQSTAYIRFRVTGPITYFFMVDDLALIEGFNNALRIDEYTINFGDTFQIRPLYTMIPSNCDYSISSDIRVLNHGSSTATNIQAYSKLYQDSSLVGIPGSGLLANTNTPGKASLATGQYDTLEIQMPYYHFLDGYHRIQTWVTSDSANQDSANAIFEYPLVITDTVFARDRNTFFGGAGPSNYVGGGYDGDRWGVLYNTAVLAGGLGSFGVDVFTISIYVANDTQNIGASIAPRIWAFDETQATLTQAISASPIGSSPFSTTISSAMLGKWVSIPLFPSARLAMNSQYIVGWEQIAGGATGNDFLAGRDRTVEPFSPPVSNFIFTNNANPAWGWVSQSAGVRVNSYLGCRIWTGLEENGIGASFAISPNPSTGQFTLQLKTASQNNYQVKIRNTLGQIVFEKELSGSALKNYQVNLSEHEKGLYFLSLESGQERWTEKVIVQ